MAHVLVVDDDKDIRTLVAVLLESEGYECTTAGSGKDALALHSATQNTKSRVDLILLDFMMPGMDGGEFVRHLDAQGDLTPVVFMSADRDIEAKVRGHQRCPVVKKPFEADELIETIERLVNCLPPCPQDLL